MREARRGREGGKFYIASPICKSLRTKSLIQTSTVSITRQQNNLPPIRPNFHFWYPDGTADKIHTAYKVSKGRAAGPWKLLG